MDEYANLNKPLWNALSKSHVQSTFYNLGQFKKTGNSLPTIDQNLLGEIKGKKILHLQCHLGLESISMARMGAEVTGLDFSEEAIKSARALNKEMGTSVNFICDNVYNTLNHSVSGKYDIVYTSYGIVPWLHDLTQWASIIKTCMKESGQFILVEFHPHIFTIDDHGKLSDHWGSKLAPDTYDMDKSYTGDKLDKNYKEFNWNHSLSQIINPLIKNGLTLTDIRDYNFSPYNCFEDMIIVGDNQFRMKIFENINIPYVFSTVFAR